MEIFLLLLGIPLLWLMLAPVRVAGRMRQHPVRTFGILSLLAFGGLVALFGLKSEDGVARTRAALMAATAPLPAKDTAPADYASADADLRALIE